jgi:peptidyl-prolyl cis-trans isomerase SurA
MTAENSTRRSLGVLALSLFALLLGSSPVGAAEHLDGIVAVVNDDVITESDLASELRLVQQQIQQQKVQAPPEQVLRRQVLERLILKRLQLELAAQRGVTVDDDTVNQAIRTIAQQNGLTLPQFRQVLDRDGFDYGAFREDLRDEIIIHRLRQRMVDNRVNVSEREVKDFLASQRRSPAAAGDEYHLAHILIAVPEAASAEQIAAARKKAEDVLAELRSGADFGQTAIAVSQGQQALQGGDLGWRKQGELPTFLVDVATQLRPGQVSDLVRSPSGFHIVKLLDKRSAARHQSNQVHLRHILVRVKEGESEDQARARLEQLRERVQSGEDFASLARAHSEDTETASRGGDIGWTDPSGLPAPFVDVLSRMSEGEVSAPFKSPYGWHIVQLLGRRAQDDTDSFARTRAEQQLHARKVEEETQAWLRQLRDEAYVEYRLDKSPSSGT